MDEVVDMARGVPQSYGVDEFADEGIMLEGIAGPPDYLAMAVPFSGAAHRELMLSYRHVAQFGMMIRDTSRGHIRRQLPRPRRSIRYDLNAHDVATIARGRRAARAAALRRRCAPRDPARRRRARAARRRPHAAARPHVTARELKLMAFHPLGTARMAERAADGVLDADGAPHGTTNLYVCDGSAVPTALGVNPQLTIMALATRLADRLLA